MGKTNLGRVAFAPHGTYSNETAYKRLDVVESEGSSYLFLKDSTGIAPTGDGEVTMLLAKKGKDFTYDDFTPEQLATLKGTDGKDGVNGADGAKGDKGDPGKGLTILGYYGTLDLLKAGVTTPEPGDAYGIGTAAPYDIYVFDGVKNDWVNNGKLSGGGDLFQLGEIRYSSRIDSPFGAKYVMCAGQSVSSNDYPNATSILGISSMSVAKSMPYTSLTETPYVEMQNMPFQINDKLIGKIRTIVIPPVGEPTEEDYINMYASMKVYLDVSIDGVNWVEEHQFPKAEGEVAICNRVFILNGELVFPINRLVISDQTMICNRLLKTSDFENFQVWDTIEMNVPETQTNDWKIKSISYGQGTYLAIFTETVGGQQKVAVLKSTDLITWEYVNEGLSSWNDASSGFPLTVSFSGNRWILQLGYTIICDSIAEIDNHHMIETIFDNEFRQVFHLDLGVEEVYFVLLSNGVYSLSYDTNRNKWKGYKQDPPSGWGNGEQYACAIPFGSGLIGWIVLGYANHYYKFPSGTEVKTLSYDITPDYPNYPIKEVFKIGTNLFLVQNDSNKSPYISKTIATIPLLSNPEIGLNAYIKLK